MNSLWLNHRPESMTYALTPAPVAVVVYRLFNGRGALVDAVEPPRRVRLVDGGVDGPVELDGRHTRRRTERRDRRGVEVGGEPERARRATRRPVRRRGRARRARPRAPARRRPPRRTDRCRQARARAIGAAAAEQLAAEAEPRRCRRPAAVTRPVGASTSAAACPLAVTAPTSSATTVRARVTRTAPRRRRFGSTHGSRSTFVRPGAEGRTVGDSFADGHGGLNPIRKLGFRFRRFVRRERRPGSFEPARGERPGGGDERQQRERAEQQHRPRQRGRPAVVEPAPDDPREDQAAHAGAADEPGGRPHP